MLPISVKNVLEKLEISFTLVHRDIFFSSKAKIQPCLSGGVSKKERLRLLTEDLVALTKIP